MLIGFLGRTTGEGGWKEDASKFRPERWLDEEGRFDSKVRKSFPFTSYPRSRTNPSSLPFARYF